MTATVYPRNVPEDVTRRVEYVRTMARMDDVTAAQLRRPNAFDHKQHVAIASAQLLEILQCAAPGRDNLREAYDHFVTAAAHLELARGYAWQPWLDEPPEAAADESSAVTFGRAQAAGETVGHEWVKAQQEAADDYGRGSPQARE